MCRGVRGTGEVVGLGSGNGWWDYVVGLGIGAHSGLKLCGINSEMNKIHTPETLLKLHWSDTDWTLQTKALRLGGLTIRQNGLFFQI